MILVHKGLSCVRHPSPDDIELIVLDLGSRSSQFRLITVYSPPRIGTVETGRLCDVLTQFTDCPHQVIILGDFNIPEIDWTMQCRPKGTSAQTFLDFIVTEGLQQLVKYPTRQDKILDLVLCTELSAVYAVQVIEPFGTSDHSSLQITVPWTDLTLEPTTYRNFCHANWTAIREYLGSLDWAHLIGHCSDVHQVWDLIFSQLDFVISSHVPLAIFKPSVSPLPLYLRKIRARRRRLFRQRRGQLGAAKYNSYNAFYKAKIRKFCKKQEERVLAGNSLNALYRFIKKKIKANSAIPALQSDCIGFQTDSDKAKNFNTFFASVFGKPENADTDSADRVFRQDLTTVQITPFMVNKVLSKLPSKLSCGPDGIPSYFYKQCQHVLALPLALLFQLSLNTTEIPHIWKRSIVVPIHKKGNRSLPTNYRPVSLLCAVSLVFERCIKQAIVSHIETNGLLSDQQFGFRKGRSVETQLLSCLDEWTAALDRGYCIDALYTDFEKGLIQFHTLNFFLS